MKLIVILLCVLFLAGCTDQLRVEPENSLTFGNITKEKDVEALGSTKQLIDKLTAGSGVSKLQLMQELFGMSRDELIKELSKNTGEE